MDISERQLEGFLAALRQDASLQDKIKMSTDNAIISVAKEAGFDFTAEDLDSFEQGLSEEELEGWGSVAGSGRSCVAECPPPVSRPTCGSGCIGTSPWERLAEST